MCDNNHQWQQKWLLLQGLLWQSCKCLLVVGRLSSGQALGHGAIDTIFKLCSQALQLQL